jgi:hypothetical protein
VSGSHLSSGEVAVQEIATSPLPPNIIRSPYENVVIPAPGTIVHPQSPRTRIRTIAPSAKYVHWLFRVVYILADALHCGGTLSYYKTDQCANGGCAPADLMLFCSTCKILSCAAFC